MPKVVLKENEGLDDALRRFKRQVSRNGTDRKSTRLNSSHVKRYRMPSSA